MPLFQGSRSFLQGRKVLKVVPMTEKLEWKTNCMSVFLTVRDIQ